MYSEKANTIKPFYQIILHCICPLFFGGYIYLQSRTVYFTQFFNVKPVWQLETAVEKFLVFTLPDFLWSYSLASALYLFAFYCNINYKRFIPVIFILIGGTEAVQVFLPGQFTFDIFDLIAQVIAIALSTVFFNTYIYEKEANQSTAV